MSRHDIPTTAMKIQRGWITAAAIALCAVAHNVSAATRSVAAGGDLQAAIDAAQPGDVIELQAGATFIGNFVLRTKAGATEITIRSSAADSALPGANTRITPAYSALLPKIQSDNSAPALVTAAGAHHYRLMFLEFGANAGGFSEIMRLGDASSAQNSLAVVPHDLVLDRVYVHGDPAIGQKRGIGLNSASTSILNSYVSDIKAVGQDAQAVAGWNGPGPYTILNNYFEGAGENFILGGADPAIPNLVISDVVFRGNYVAKPMSWRGAGWQIKNLFELKNAQRVVVDGNIFENNWLEAQTGYAILFTPRNQDGTAPWVVVQHVQFTNNIVRHSGSAMQIAGNDDTHPSQTSNDIVVRNNLFVDISKGTYGGDGRMLQISGGFDITIDHNTVRADGDSMVYAYDFATIGFTFTNNIMPDNLWAIFGGDSSPGNGTIAQYFPGGVILDNVIAGAPAGSYPIGNYYPSSMANVGFVSLANGDYHLGPTSPYRTGASDGGPVGCNVDALPTNAVITGIGIGAPPPAPPAPPTPPPPPPPSPAPAPSAPAPDPAPSEPPPSGGSNDGGTIVVSTEPTYEVPPPPGSYGFSDHGYYRPNGGWQETRMIAPAGTTFVRAAVPQTFTTTSTPIYEVPPPPGSYGFSDHGYYRPTGGWQETRMISPGVTIQTTVAAASPTPAGIPHYTTPPPPGSYGFTDHGYYRPDGGWQSATTFAVSTPAVRAAASSSVTVTPNDPSTSVASAPPPVVDSPSSPPVAAPVIVPRAPVASTTSSQPSVAPMVVQASAPQPSSAASATPTSTARAARIESIDVTPRDASPSRSASTTTSAVVDNTPRVQWSVAPQPGVTSYQWWIWTGGRWTLAQDWTASTTFSQPYDPTAAIPLVGVVMR